MTAASTFKSEILPYSAHQHNVAAARVFLFHSEAIADRNIQIRTPFQTYKDIVRAVAKRAKCIGSRTSRPQHGGVKIKKNAPFRTYKVIISQKSCREKGIYTPFSFNREENLLF